MYALIDEGEVSEVDRATFEGDHVEGLEEAQAGELLHVSVVLVDGGFEEDVGELLTQSLAFLLLVSGESLFCFLNGSNAFKVRGEVA